MSNVPYIGKLLQIDPTNSSRIEKINVELFTTARDQELAEAARFLMDAKSITNMNGLELYKLPALYHEITLRFLKLMNDD